MCLVSIRGGFSAKQLLTAKLSILFMSEQTTACRVYLHFTAKKESLLGFRKTFGMGCQEDTLNTTEQYQGSELLCFD